jgi:hypothetical protein
LVRQQHSATHYEIVMLARALCASGSEILKNNPAAAREKTGSLRRFRVPPSLVELPRTSRSLQQRASRIENEPRPPPGELAEAAFYIAPRLEIAMRCGSSCLGLSVEGGEGVCQSEQAGAFSAFGMIPSLTSPFQGEGIFSRLLVQASIHSKRSTPGKFTP